MAKAKQKKLKVIIIQGDLVFNGAQYSYQYNQQENYLQLHTTDPESKLDVEFICRETGDTARRWKEFQRIFARSVAKKHFGFRE